MSEEDDESENTSAKGAAYERFVRDVYQLLLNEESIRTVRAEHDVTLTGRSKATHQIDVFWEFELAGARYRTCIECKAYASRVKKSQIAAFSGTLQDLGNPTGIFVTTVGYQDGAKKLAEDRGIRLLVVNPIIRKIALTMVLQAPEYSNVSIQLDVEASKPILRAAGRENVEVSFAGSGEQLLLLDEAGNSRGNLNDFVRTQSGREGHHSVSMKGYFIASEVGPLPLLSIEYDLAIHELRQPFSVEAKEAAKAVVEDVLEHTTKYVKDAPT